MTHDLDETMKEKITTALRAVLGQRKEAIRERLLACLADHVEQELNDFAEPPALDDALFAHSVEPGQAPPPQRVPSLPAPSPQGLKELLQATQLLTRCNDQVSILECLIEGAARFSGRAVVFVCRNGQAMGWEQSGFAANAYSMAIRGAILPLSKESVLSRVVSGGGTLSGDETRLADPVWKAIGTDRSPRFTAVPLTVRGRIAAILFADAGAEEDPQPLQADALGILARMAEMSLETLTLRAERGQAQPAAPAQQQEATAAASPRVEEPRASLAPVEPAAVAVPPQFMSPPPEVADPEAHEASAPETPSLPAGPPQVEAVAAAEEAAKTEAEDEAMADEAMADEAMADEAMADAHQDEASAPEEASAAQEPAAGEQAEEAEVAASPVSEEEQLHEQARRFARLLISEILLYNPDQVEQGKQQRDLADRLKEDLERSEKMYRRRVAPHVAAQTNYFQEEVLRTLADGDPAILGD